MNLNEVNIGIDVGLGRATSQRHLLTSSLKPHFWGISIQDDPVPRPREFLLPESCTSTFPLRERALGEGP